MTTTFATAALSDIKSFLAANAADAGLASAMKFDGWKMADVRSYADRVQALRDAGYTAAITPRTVAAAEQQVANERAAAEAARVAAEAATAAELLAMVEAQVAAAGATVAKKKEQAKGSDKHCAMLAKAIEQGEHRDDGSVVLGSALILAVGFSACYATQRCGWSTIKSGGAAANKLGFACTTTTDKTQPGGFVVVLRRAA